MTPPSVLGSVVIPAHNEEAVVGRCLDEVLAGFAPGELEVVVVCNGCTDKTADVARSHADYIQVLELGVASKPAALRAADSHLSTFPRIYLDADVVLPSSAARAVLKTLREGRALAGRPPIRYDTSHSSRLVRHYYCARSQLDSVMTSLWGAGVYVLTEEGRERFGRYPDVVGEDLFVDQQFADHEIEIVECDPVTVYTPRRLRDLFRILRRTYRGNAENHSALGGASTTTSTLRTITRLVTSTPSAGLDATIYSVLAIASRCARSHSTAAAWERDDSSRFVDGHNSGDSHLPAGG